MLTGLPSKNSQREARRKRRRKETKDRCTLGLHGLLLSKGPFSPMPGASVGTAISVTGADSLAASSQPTSNIDRAHFGQFRASLAASIQKQKSLEARENLDRLAMAPINAQKHLLSGFWMVAFLKYAYV